VLDGDVSTTFFPVLAQQRDGRADEVTHRRAPDTARPNMAAAVRPSGSTAAITATVYCRANTATFRMSGNTLPGRRISPVAWSNSNGRGVKNPTGISASAAVIQATSGHTLSSRRPSRETPQTMNTAGTISARDSRVVRGRIALIPCHTR
jgi:hypothetical protein